MTIDSNMHQNTEPAVGPSAASSLGPNDMPISLQMAQILRDIYIRCDAEEWSLYMKCVSNIIKKTSFDKEARRQLKKLLYRRPNLQMFNEALRSEVWNDDAFNLPSVRGQTEDPNAIAYRTAVFRRCCRFSKADTKTARIVLLEYVEEMLHTIYKAEFENAAYLRVDANKTEEVRSACTELLCLICLCRVT